MFAPLPPPAFTCPGSLLAFADVTLSVIACNYIIREDRVKSQGYNEV